MTPSRNVSELLKHWRAHTRLSQSQAAELLDVNLRTFQGWEAGRDMPYPTILEFAVTRMELQIPKHSIAGQPLRLIDKIKHM